MCRALGAEDGLDPREYFKSAYNGRNNRKALQLCRQAERALRYALSNAHDEVLRDLVVEYVQPAPNASHLLVMVTCADPQVSVPQILNRLGKATGYLRTELAAAIHRRRTPQLSFQVQRGA